MKILTKSSLGVAIVSIISGVLYGGYLYFSPNTIGSMVVLSGKKLISSLSQESQEANYIKATSRYLTETKTKTGEYAGNALLKLDEIMPPETGKWIKLKDFCEKHEKLLFTNKDDRNYKRVERWCTQFKSIKEKHLEDNKELEDSENKEKEWKEKYEKVEDKLKIKVDLFKGGSASNQEAKAMQNWCKSTFKRDSEDAELFENSEKCLFKTKASR